MKEIATQNLGMYSICWILAFFGFGILGYILDRQFMSPFLGKIYKASHKGPRAKEKGIVYGQSSGRKFFLATLISTAQSFGLFYFLGFHYNPFVELVLWFIEIPAMVAGLGMGYLVWPWWEKRFVAYKFLDSVDQTVEGWQSQRKAAKDPDASSEQEGGKTPADPIAPSQPPPAKAAADIPPKQAAPVTAMAPPELVIDPRERIAQYAKRRRN